MLEVMTEPVDRQAVTGASDRPEQASTAADFVSMLLGLVASPPAIDDVALPADEGILLSESPGCGLAQTGMDAQASGTLSLIEALEAYQGRGSETSPQPRGGPAEAESAGRIPHIGDFLPVSGGSAAVDTGHSGFPPAVSGSAAQAQVRTARSEPDPRDLPPADDAPEFWMAAGVWERGPQAEVSGPASMAAGFDLPDPLRTDRISAADDADSALEVRTGVGEAHAGQFDPGAEAEPADIVTAFARTVESRLTGDTTAPREPAIARGDHGAELTRAVAGHLIREVSLLRSGENATLTIRLTPPELGSLRVSVRSEFGVLTTELQSPNEAVRGLLESSLPALREQLTSAGIEISRFTVSAGLDFGQLADRRPQTWRQAGTASNPTYLGTDDRFDDRGASASAAERTTAGYDWLA